MTDMEVIDILNAELKEVTFLLKLYKHNGKACEKLERRKFVLEAAIKALESQKGDKTQVLDNIRTEIETLEYLNIEDGSDGYDKYIEQYEVLKIIDKYKKESGHKELAEPMQASINSKRKGRWIFHDSSLDGSFYECSCCHVRDDDLPYKGQIFDTHYCNFCPNCGADMRESEE